MDITITLNADEEAEAQKLCDEGTGTYVADSESPKPPNLTIQQLLEWHTRDYLRQKRITRAKNDAVKAIPKMPVR